MSRAVHAIRSICSLACLAMVAATVASYLRATAQFPIDRAAWISYLTSSRLLAGVPVEFGLALWFLGSASCSPVKWRLWPYVGFWFSLVVAAVCGGLIYLTSFHNVPALAGLLASVAIIALSLSLAGRIPTASRRELVGWLRADWESHLRPRTMLTAVGVLGLYALLSQYMMLTVSATGPAQTDAALMRWFRAEPQLRVEQLVDDNSIKIVIFTDYLCPACSFLVPQVEAVVNRYRLGGLDRIELQRRDFPLNSECNSAIQGPVHLLACRAAAAARLADARLSEAQAQRFRERLYRLHGKMSEEDFALALNEFGLGEPSLLNQGDLLKLVRADAEAGRRLGLSGTPAIFIDGRLLRGSAQAKMVEAILAEEIRRRNDR